MYTLYAAIDTAHAVIDRLAPHCERIDMAGSVRRRCNSVKDIEIVCQPKKQLKIDATKLFDDGYWVVCDEFQIVLDTVTAAVERGNINGRYMKIILKNGMPLDLFMPNYSDYYRQLVIRTGSGDYVKNVSAATWRMLGLCGTDQGLRKMAECSPKTGTDGSISWKCTTEHPKLPPVWQSEEEFFTWLGLPFTPP